METISQPQLRIFNFGEGDAYQSGINIRITRIDTSIESYEMPYGTTELYIADLKTILKFELQSRNKKWNGLIGIITFGTWYDYSLLINNANLENSTDCRKDFSLSIKQSLLSWELIPEWIVPVNMSERIANEPDSSTINAEHSVNAREASALMYQHNQTMKILTLIKHYEIPDKYRNCITEVFNQKITVNSYFLPEQDAQTEEFSRIDIRLLVWKSILKQFPDFTSIGGENSLTFYHTSTIPIHFVSVEDIKRAQDMATKQMLIKSARKQYQLHAMPAGNMVPLLLHLLELMAKESLKNIINKVELNAYPQDVTLQNFSYNSFASSSPKLTIYPITQTGVSKKIVEALTPHIHTIKPICSLGYCQSITNTPLFACQGLLSDRLQKENLKYFQEPAYSRYEQEQNLLF